eukprot:c22283_g2_i1 orf=545-1375(+)
MELNNALRYGKLRGDFISFKLYMQVMMLAIVAIANTAQVKARGPALALAPAPAPTPAFENVTQSLIYGGEYSTFMDLLVETKEDVIFQSMANNTEGPGITIFAPTDKAFSSKLVSSLLKNLTASQKVSLVEYHALGVYQAFKNLQNSNHNQTNTLASNGGGRYQVNITFTGGGRLEISSGWTTALLSTTIYSQSPVSIFGIDQVLLADEIFGLPPPPPPPSPPIAHTPTPSPPSSSSSTSRPTITKDSSFSSPLFAPCISSILLSLLLFKLITSGL